jgi:hypothetical protein
VQQEQIFAVRELRQIQPRRAQQAGPFLGSGQPVVAHRFAQPAVGLGLDGIDIAQTSN